MKKAKDFNIHSDYPRWKNSEEEIFSGKTWAIVLFVVGGCLGLFAPFSGAPKILAVISLCVWAVAALVRWISVSLEKEEQRKRKVVEDEILGVYADSGIVGFKHPLQLLAEIYEAVLSGNETQANALREQLQYQQGTATNFYYACTRYSHLPFVEKLLSGDTYAVTACMKDHTKNFRDTHDPLPAITAVWEQNPQHHEKWTFFARQYLQSGVVYARELEPVFDIFSEDQFYGFVFDQQTKVYPWQYWASTPNIDP